VSERVQQPYEISVLSAIKEAKGITISITIYPNPTITNLRLSINEFDHSNISYQLFDLNGKLLQNEKISSNHTNIAMDNFVPSTYIIKVIQNNSEVKIFKIIKSH
jgi:hypothetical protein